MLSQREADADLREEVVLAGFLGRGAAVLAAVVEPRDTFLETQLPPGADQAHGLEIVPATSHLGQQLRGKILPDDSPGVLKCRRVSKVRIEMIAQWDRAQREQEQ